MPSRFPLLRCCTFGFAFFVGALLASPLVGAEKIAAPVWIGTAKGPAWKNVEELRGYADRGDTDACFELGDRLINGDGVAANVKEARNYFERAASAGHPDALFRLGKIYHDGLGVERNRARGFDFYTQAAQRGVPEAMHNVGAMLVSGRGVKRDYVEGLAWLIVATKHGAVSMAEQQVRERLKRRPDDLTRAEARAKVLQGEMKNPSAIPVPAAETMAERMVPPRAPTLTPAPSTAPTIDVQAPTFAPPMTVPLTLPGPPKKSE